jgi:hypothetical protein
MIFTTSLAKQLRKPYGNPLMIVLNLILLFALCNSMPFQNVTSAQEMNIKSSIHSESDIQLIEELATTDYAKANATVDEILNRGVRIVPLLVQKRGDQRFFRGSLSRDQQAAVLVAVPTGNPNKDKRLLKSGKLVTVEVAAIYLITAIYYNSLNIAQSPYLTDLSLPSVKRDMANTSKRVDRAWKAVEGWHQRLASSDIANLRSKDDYPLSTANVDFW